MDLSERIKNIRKSTGYNQSDFGKLFDYTGQQISNLEKGKTKPNDRFINVLKAKYGPDFGLTPQTANRTPVGAQSTVPYVQPAEKMLPEDKGGEMRPGSYGIPDLSGHHVTQVFEPELDMYLGMARTILTSGQAGTINALKSNLIAFNEQVKDKAQLRAMGEKIDKLDKEIVRLKTIAGGCAETSADREAGNQ